MMKKLTWVLVLLLIMVSSVSAQDEYDPSKIAWTCPKGFEGQTLHVANWSNYIGAKTIRTFEQLCGVKVKYSIYNSNEEILENLRNSQAAYDYDIAIPNDYVIAELVRDRLIQRIDISRIPNMANISQQWRNTPFDPDNEYSVPYLWGTTALAFNINNVPSVPLSWMDFFTYEGPVAWVNDNRTMLSIALSVLGFDPNSDNEEEIAAAREFLAQHADNVYEVADDTGQALLEEGLVDMAVEYNGDIYQLSLDCECGDYGYVIPEEGTVFDLEVMVVPTRALNPELAMVFMDYIHDPYVNAQIMNDTGYATTNQAALDNGFVLPELLNNTVINPSASGIERSWTLQDVGESDLIYTDEWARLRYTIGK